MSTFAKTTDNTQALGVGGGSLSVNSDITFKGKVYCTNAQGYFNLQYGDVTSLQNVKPNYPPTQGYSNVAIGMQTLPSLNTGYSNTVVGNYALYNATTAYQNTAIGTGSMYLLTTGKNNISMGGNAGQSITTGSDNTNLGQQTMFAGSNGNASQNTCVGSQTGWYINGNCNVAVGYSAGGGMNGNNNTVVGSNANCGGGVNQSTCIGYGASVSASNQIMLGTATETVYIPNAMVTQGLMYEVVNVANQSSTNAPTLSYGAGGVFTLGTSITANATLAVTNIPTDTTKSFTFTVSYQQTSTRFYIATVQLQDTAGAYITNAGTSGFVAPLWNGGTPSLSGTTNCVIVQSFTVISVGGSRRVVSSLSCCS